MIPNAHPSPAPFRSIAIVCGLVFCIRLLLLELAPNSPLHTPVTFRDDEVDYWAVTQALTGSGFRSFEPAGKTSDQRRPPVFPLLAALVVEITGEGYPFTFTWTILQVLFESVALGLALWTAQRLAIRASAALAIALAAFDLITLSLCCKFLSEPLYTMLFAGSLALLPIGRGEKSGYGRSIASGIFLALATLTRPIAQFFVLISLAVTYAKTDARGWRRALPAVALAAAFFLPVGTWMTRNARVHGKAFVSEIGKLALYLDWAGQIEAWNTHRPFEEVYQERLDRLDQVTRPDPSNARVRQDFLMRESIPILLSRPSAYPRFAARALKMVFWGRATSAMNALYGQERVGIVGHLRRGGPLPFLILVWGELAALLALYGLVIRAVIVAWRNRKSASWCWAVAVFLLPAVYHFCLSWGPEATARFRAAMMPWLIVLAAGAIHWSWRQSHERRDPAPDQA